MPPGIPRLSGPWLRRIMYTGAAPDKNGELYLSENATRLTSQLPAVDKRNAHEYPSMVAAPGIVPPAYWAATWPWFPPWGLPGGGVGPGGGFKFIGGPAPLVAGGAWGIADAGAGMEAT